MKSDRIYNSKTIATNFSRLTNYLVWLTKSCKSINLIFSLSKLILPHSHQLWSMKNLTNYYTCTIHTKLLLQLVAVVFETMNKFLCLLVPNNHSQNNRKCPVKHLNCNLYLMYHKNISYGSIFWELYLTSYVKTIYLCSNVTPTSRLHMEKEIFTFFGVLRIYTYRTFLTISL